MQLLTMGSWGSGILDNDTTLGYIGNLVQRVVSDLNADLESLEDGNLERETGACISVLTVLVEKCYTASAFVTVENVQVWKNRMSEWLSTVVESEPDDRKFWEAHKNVLEEEFDRLTKAIENAQ